MIYKLNASPALDPEATNCDLSAETSNNEIPVSIDGPDGAKAQVANYKKVLLNDFKVPEAMFFNTVPMNIRHMLSFITNNWEDTAAIRIYFAKKSPDASNPNDYEMFFVPCKAIKDSSGNVLYYEDKLDESTSEGATKSSIISIECRRPPGCTRGARLLEP